MKKDSSNDSGNPKSENKEVEALANHLGSKEEAEFIAEKVKMYSGKLKEAHAEIANVVWGQDEVIENTITCAVAGGHLLAVGLPGLAKTRLVESFATVMGLNQERVQFTPDLMPSDIIGSEVHDQNAEGKSEFRFVKGPIFTQFFMADEINRAGPRTQSALLQAMQEGKVTVAGQTYHLQRPYIVMATQNPLEQEGTYPLPEAQLDRFLMKLNYDYPTEEAERKVTVVTTGTKDNIKELCERDVKGEDLTNEVDKDKEVDVKQVLGKNDLLIMQKLARKLPLSQDVQDAISQIVRKARPSKDNRDNFITAHVAWGPGPRASQAFAQAAKARALMDGRLAPNVNDVLAMVEPVLEHRMALNFSARAEGIEFKDIVEHITKGLGTDAEKPKGKVKAAPSL